MGQFRGRKILGDEIRLGVQCRNASRTPSAPTAAPQMRIYAEAGTLVLSKAIPPTEKSVVTGLFEYMQPLNSSFSAGRYYARYTWSVSGTDFVDWDCFEIKPGGDASGQYIALAFLDRPDADWIVAQHDMGGVVVNRGPRV